MYTGDALSNYLLGLRIHNIWLTENMFSKIIVNYNFSGIEIWSNCAARTTTRQLKDNIVTNGMNEQVFNLHWNQQYTRMLHYKDNGKINTKSI